MAAVSAPECFQWRDRPDVCCRDEPEAGVSFFLLGQNELRCRLSRRESEGAEGGLRVADPLQVLPEDLHHLGAHLLVKSHLYQLVGKLERYNIRCEHILEVLEISGAETSSFFSYKREQTRCFHI